MSEQEEKVNYRAYALLFDLAESMQHKTLEQQYRLVGEFEDRLAAIRFAKDICQHNEDFHGIEIRNDDNKPVYIFRTTSGRYVLEEVEKYVNPDALTQDIKSGFPVIYTDDISLIVDDMPVVLYKDPSVPDLTDGLPF